MSIPDFDEWTPQRPNADFADLAVRAMIRLPARKSRGGRGRKWFGLLTLAAILGGSSTWAMWGHNQAQAQPLELNSAIGPVTADVRLPHEQPLVVEEAAEPVAAKPVAKAPLAVVRHVRKAPAAKPEPAVEEPVRPRYVIQPRCACDIDAIVCGCVDSD